MPAPSPEPRRTEPSIEGALERVAEIHASPADIAGALAEYAEDRPAAPAAPAAEGAPARSYRVREAAIVLATFALAMAALDSEGLLTWARRWEVGRAQGALLSTIGPVHRGLDAVGLTLPRRALVEAAGATAQGLGAGGDPLLEEAWRLVAEAPTVAEPDEEVPSIDVPPPLPVEPPAAGPQPVLLVGDSMFAGNLAAAIRNAFAGDATLRVAEAYQTATGLSRPDIFDWRRLVPALLARESPRFVVVSFGANDAQAIRLGDELVPFGEAGWDKVYRSRVRAMMRALTGGGARVLWLGLPPMRDPALSRRAQHLNRLFARCAREVPGVEFLEIGMLFASADGSYSTYLGGGGGLARMRMEDGVHYSPAGARVLARWIVDWVRERRRQPAARER